MKIALLQSALIWGNVEENLRHFDQKLTRNLDCDVILLPEMFPCGCMMVKKEKSLANAEKIKVASCYGEICCRMSEWAVRQNALIMGSTVYEERGCFYNRLVAAFPGGEYQYYDKRHCFRMGGENEHFTPGNKRLSLLFRGWKIAPFICYDLRFPVWSRNTDHYDLAVYIANWPESRRKVWQSLLVARAIENQAYVAGVNCVGTDNGGLRYAGDSVVINARGEVLGEGKTFEDQIIIAEIDKEELNHFRQKFAVLDDRDAFRFE
ncbi:amidohydrolase [uncultured Odoribacter sp.]|uniref:amidohydrolase n=1 Tax=uncultured Odoribacter sp. TaxID=876416 RepID=UPI0026317B35|nr:amidohydrolase [uncultured Odoribacter sp.]